METSTNNAAVETAEKKRKHLRFSPVDTPLLNPVRVSEPMPDSELAKIINNFFAEVTKDYYGCTFKVEFDQRTGTQVVKPVFYFSILDEKVYNQKKELDANEDYESLRLAFMPLSSDSGASMLQRVQKLSLRSARSDNRSFYLTADGEDLISAIGSPINKKSARIVTPGDDKPDWSGNYSYDPYEKMIKLEGIDINKVLAYVLGDNDPENDSDLYYQIRVTGTKSQIAAQNAFLASGFYPRQQFNVNGNMTNDPFIFEIIQINDKYEREAGEKLGLTMNAGSSVYAANPVKQSNI